MSLFIFLLSKTLFPGGRWGEGKGRIPFLGMYLTADAFTTDNGDLVASTSLRLPAVAAKLSEAARLAVGAPGFVHVVRRRLCGPGFARCGFVFGCHQSSIIYSRKSY